MRTLPYERCCYQRMCLAGKELGDDARKRATCCDTSVDQLNFPYAITLPDGGKAGGELIHQPFLICRLTGRSALSPRQRSPVYCVLSRRRLRNLAPATPTNPVPSSTIVVGSGMALTVKSCATICPPGGAPS